MEWLRRGYAADDLRVWLRDGSTAGRISNGARRIPRLALRMKMRGIFQARVRYGYCKLRVLLRPKGWKGEKSLLQRLYKMEGTGLKQRQEQR